MTKESSAKKKAPSSLAADLRLNQNWPLYVMLIPSIVLAIIFCYIPMGGLIMAFQDYKLLQYPKSPVGWWYQSWWLCC